MPARPPALVFRQYISRLQLRCNSAKKQIRSHKKQTRSQKQIRSYKNQTITNYANKICDKAGDYSGMRQHVAFLTPLGNVSIILLPHT